MTTLFWDIDGTLLLTNKAGVVAWREAASAVTGQPVDLGALQTAGLTDHQIALRISRDVEALDGSEATALRLVAEYESRLPDCLSRRNGRVLDNVLEILEAAATRPDVRCYLLTGNTRRGGGAKLAHYGLSRFFPAGAFSEDFADRATIARRALALDGVSGDASTTLVIGDTPRDIECANAIGARTLAVATGDYSSQQLEAHRPWRVVGRLPAPSDFFDLVTSSAERV